MIPYDQLSLADIFSDCQEIYGSDKPAFLSLLQEHIDLDEIVPASFRRYFYTSMAGGASSGSAGAESWYRVRKSWADVSSQKGAFKSLENAKNCADENPGYSVFDESGKAVYTGSAAFKPYLVRVSIPNLNIRKGPGTDHAKTGKYTGAGTFTLVEEADGKGAYRRERRYATYDRYKGRAVQKNRSPEGKCRYTWPNAFPRYRTAEGWIHTPIESG